VRAGWLWALWLRVVGWVDKTVEVGRLGHGRWAMGVGVGMGVDARRGLRLWLLGLRDVLLRVGARIGEVGVGVESGRGCGGYGCWGRIYVHHNNLLFRKLK
jgi:hypothetical protein